MRGLHGLAWRGLRARPLRTSLTIVGVALGVAVLSAGLSTNAGIGASVDRAVGTLVGRADLRVAAFGEAGLPRTASCRRRYARRRGRGAVGRAPHVSRYRAVRACDRCPTPVTVVGIDPGARALAARPVPRTPARDRPGDAPVALVSETLAREDGMIVGDRRRHPGRRAPTDLQVVGILAGDGPWSGGERPGGRDPPERGARRLRRRGPDPDRRRVLAGRGSRRDDPRDRRRGCVREPATSCRRRATSPRRCGHRPRTSPPPPR